MAFSAFPLLILILVFPSDLVTIETGEDSLSLRTSTNTTEERNGSNIVIMTNYHNSFFHDASNTIGNTEYVSYYFRYIERMFNVYDQ